MRTALLPSVILALLLVAPAAASATTADGVAVTGTVVLDLDGDGTVDDGEPGRADVRVTLRTSATILDAVTTDADGTWSFGNVPAGTYEVLVEPPVDHEITGGTLPDLDVEAGSATLTVASSDIPDAGTVAIGSPVSSGPDIAATVAYLASPDAPSSLGWRVTAHNLGPDDAEGPVALRIVLSSDHEATDVDAGPWACEQSAAIVLCDLDQDAPAGSSLPAITLTSAPAGDVGASVTVTGTARLDGTFDAAPLNDEDSASAAIDAALAADDIDGDGTGDLTNAGAAVTGLLAAALLALVGGTAVVATSRRVASRP